MIKRLLLGTVISLVVVILPAVGNTEILRASHLWILAAFGIVASLLQPGYNPFTITAQPGDRGTGFQIIWSVYVTQLAAILESAYLRYPRSVEWDVVAIIAVVIMALGLSLRTWAVVTLGDLFTMHIAVRSDHTIIRRGPYRIVRHPSYLGAFIMYTATAVFLHAWYSVAAAAVILPIAFLRRMAREEEMLKAEFGAEYEAYSLQVSRIIPGVW